MVSIISASPIKFLFQRPPPTPSIKNHRISATMETDGRRRVVVCGGGVIGVCTAYFLSKKGAAVTLIEQSSIACAASGKAGGFLALDWCDSGPVSGLARASFNLHRSLSEELDGPSSYGYRPLTTLSLTINESSHKNKKGSSNLPIPPWVDGPAQDVKPIGTAQTTAQVHPQMFTKAVMAAAVERYGVEMVVGRVEGVGVGDGGGVESVVLGDGRVVEAETVVVSTGPWTGKLGLVSSAFRVYGMKAHSVVLEPKDPDVITPHALFLNYYLAEGGKPIDPEVYPRPTGEVYICGMSTEAEVPNDPEQVTPNPDSIKVLKRVAGNVSSHFGDGEARVTTEQACFLPCTDDDLPVIGELPGVKGCFVATGHSCWGILNGPATGAALAELIIDGQASLVDLAPFSPSRFAAGTR